MRGGEREGEIERMRGREGEGEIERMRGRERASERGNTRSYFLLSNSTCFHLIYLPVTLCIPPTICISCPLSSASLLPPPSPSLFPTPISIIFFTLISSILFRAVTNFRLGDDKSGLLDLEKAVALCPKHEQVAYSFKNEEISLILLNTTFHYPPMCCSVHN